MFECVEVDRRGWEEMLYVKRKAKQGSGRMSGELTKGQHHWLQLGYRGRHIIPLKSLVYVLRVMAN